MGSPALILVVSFWVRGLHPSGLAKSLRHPETRSESKWQQKGASTGANSEKCGCGADLAQGPNALFDRRVAGEKP
jgi:hypothetical protein